MLNDSTGDVRNTPQGGRFHFESWFSLRPQQANPANTLSLVSSQALRVAFTGLDIALGGCRDHPQDNRKKKILRILKKR